MTVRDIMIAAGAIVPRDDDAPPVRIPVSGPVLRIGEPVPRRREMPADDRPLQAWLAGPAWMRRRAALAEKRAKARRTP